MIMMHFMKPSDSLPLLRAKLQLANVRYALDHDEGRIDRPRLYLALQQAWLRREEASR